MNPLKRLLANHLDFLLLAALTLGVQIPFLRSDVWPHHDTFESFSAFYLFYNGFVTYGEWPFWVPFGFYGIPSHVFQNILSPAFYLFILIGKIFSISNVLFMFKSGILLEQILLLLGTYRLSGLIFQKRSTRFFVCLGVVLSVVWINQLVLNFRTYSLLPFAFYYLILFCERLRPHFLWLAGFFLSLPLMGTAAYYAPLYMVLVFFFLIPFLPVVLKNLKVLFEPSLKNVLFFALFIGTAFFLIYFVASSFQGLSNYSDSRDPETHAVTLQSFLEYGGHTGPQKYLGFVHAGPVVKPSKFGLMGNSGGGETVDFTVYIGLLSLVFAVYAFSRKQDRVFWAFASAALFLFFFSLGDPFLVTRGVYYFFPPIRLFRHIGVIAGMLKFFILILSGFGLDHFLKEVQAKRSPLFGFWISSAAVLSIFLISQFVLNANGQMYPKTWPLFDSQMWILWGISIVFISLLSVRSGRWTAFAILGFLTLNLFAYQQQVFSAVTKWPKLNPDLKNTNAYSFESVRSNALPKSGRGAAAWKIVFSTTRYTSIYNWMGLDRCYSSYRTDFLTNGMDRLYRARGGTPPDHIPLKDAWFAETIGCESPKLQLTRDVLYVSEAKTAELAVRELPPESQVTILNTTGLPEIAGINQKMAQSVEILSYQPNRLKLKAEVADEKPAWLVYADSYFAGWKAYVDGIETPVREANLAFKAVLLQPGIHEVQFRFKSKGACLQIMACVLGVISLGFVIYDFKNR